MEKLQIKVLPCVIVFADGVTKDRCASRPSTLILRLIWVCRLVGFEELGNNDAFDTAALELRLSMSGASTIVVATVSAELGSCRCS